MSEPIFADTVSVPRWAIEKALKHLDDGPALALIGLAYSDGTTPLRLADAKEILMTIRQRQIANLGAAGGVIRLAPRTSSTSSRSSAACSPSCSSSNGLSSPFTTSPD